MFSPSDTIVALATAPAPAGIGVVRLSGPQAAAIARSMLTLGHDLAPRHATLTHVVAREAPALSTPGLPRPLRPLRPPRGDPGPGALRGERRIDEVVATFFPGPHSYTAEDVVEISAHGSLELLREILAAAVAAGARLAEPGEFTLRAFLNGRVDLVQAEAVGDLVSAVTPLQARVAFDQLEGTLTRAIGALDAQLFDLVAKLEASVDFPDEGYHFVGAGEAEAALVRVRDGVESLLATSARGRLIREGRHIAILGRPNVGKSSLFNALVGTDRAIVTAIPGTTRDLLRETIDFEGVRLGLVDTAGIRHTDDEIEREGVARARGAGGVADLVLLVLDRSRPLEDQDRALLRDAAGSPPRVVVVNKSDLAAAWGPGDVFGGPGPARSTENQEKGVEIPPVGDRDTPTATEPVAGPSPTGLSPQRGDWAGPSPVEVSLKTGDGMDALRAAMREALGMAPAGGSGVAAPEPLRDAPIVSNVRHAALLEEARASLDRAISNLRAAGEQASEELVIADVAEARRAFEDVTGRRTSEDLLRHIFANFCIGK